MDLRGPPRRRTCAPDVLVNNAGINVKGATATFRINQFDALHRVNLRAPFILTQAALPAMIDRGWGRIVNITSIWSVVAEAEDAAYCSAKFGLDGLTASIAAEVARHNVLVNAVAPGFTRTEAADAAYTPEELRATEELIPIGRLAQPGEIAALVGWLAGDKNTYLTGQNILIDGGLRRTAHP